MENNTNQNNTNQNDGQNSQAMNETASENIKDFGSTEVQNSRGNIHCLTIVGEIEGHTQLPPSSKATKYEHVLPLLVSVEQDEKVDALLLVLNTMGGDVEAGLAIAELISSMTKPTASIVLGGGHSIGVPLAVSAKRSFIASSATMTIHPVRMSGMVIGVPQTYEYFRQMQDRITNFVVRNSNIRKEKFCEKRFCIFRRKEYGYGYRGRNRNGMGRENGKNIKETRRKTGNDKRGRRGIRRNHGSYVRLGEGSGHTGKP